MEKQRRPRGLIFQHLLQVFQPSNLYTVIRERQTSAQPKPRHLWSGRSLWIRHLDCGSCNGCELELAALENPVYDAPRLGIEFKASPRHADIVVMTGPFTRNLAEAAALAVEAMPEPRVVLVGDCAIDGCKYQGSYALARRPPGIEHAIVARVPGCPPTPQQILDVLTGLKLE